MLIFRDAQGSLVMGWFRSIFLIAFCSAVLVRGKPMPSLAVLLCNRCRFASGGLAVACMNELGNIMARGQANVNGMFRAGTSIIVFQSLSQCMCSDANDGIDLGVKGIRASKCVHRNAIFLDFVDCALEILITHKRQNPNQVVGPPEHTRRQNGIYFSPLGRKLADRRLHVATP